MCEWALRIARTLSVTMGLLMPVLPAAGGTFTWNSGSSGSYSDGTKWTPAGPPGSGDSVLFNHAAAPTYTVTVPAGTSADSATVTGDTLSLDLSGGMFSLNSAANALTVQNDGARHSDLTIKNGTLSLPNGTIKVIDAAHATSLRINAGTVVNAKAIDQGTWGQLTVNGALSLPSHSMGAHTYFLVSGSGASFTTILPASGGGFTYGDVTIGGTAFDTSFYAQSGGKLRIGGNLIAGTGGNYSYASVFGSESLLQVGDPATGKMSDFIIGQSAPAVSYMRSSSQTVVTRDMYIGHLPNSSGLALPDATVNIGRDLRIGADPAIPVPAGSTPAVGSMNNGGGNITVGRTIHVFPGGTIDHDGPGIISAASGVQNSGQIGGNGTISAELINAGVLVPEGIAARRFTISGHYAQTSSGVLRVKIDTDLPSPIDQFVVTGPDIDLDGTIEMIMWGNGSHPVHVGDQFLVMRTSSTINYSAEFAQLQGFKFHELIQPGVGLYAVVDEVGSLVPEPASLGLMIACGSLLALRRRRDR